MTKTLKIAIDFGLNNIGLKKIIAITEKGNIKSQNILKRLNFIEEPEQDNYITSAYQSDLQV